MVLACSLLCPAAEKYSFRAAGAAETVAELDLRSPGADWAVAGREAAVAVVRVDGGGEQHVMTWAGAGPHTYRIFLGKLQPGPHELTVDRSAEHSAAGAGLEVAAVRFREASGEEGNIVARAPVLYARQNTIGKFSDVPLLMYCERDGETLVYTVIFSNEDGGTSTRALMARWGRSTDIEYVYRVLPGGRAIVQGPDHKDMDFTGRYEGLHPLLMPVTNNNMIGEAKDSPLRFQLAPVLVDLQDASRETVMDSNPATYQVMAKELAREGKIRAFGTVEGQDISDVRNYAYVDYLAEHTRSGMTVTLVLRDGRLFSSDLGVADYAITRDGWVRSTVELPPGTKSSDIANVGFQCVLPPKTTGAGTCRLERVRKAFFLDAAFRPGTPWFSLNRSFTIPTGQGILLKP